MHQSIVHTPGNLTLTGYNSELSNSSFEIKRAQLKSSGLVMNQRIADRDAWTRSAIVERADELAERIIATWPGPNAAVADPETNVIWLALAQVLAEIPAGAWTTYSDVAAVIGTHQVPLGQRLANFPVPNAHRVLKAGGVVAPNFRWPDPGRKDDPRSVLAAEGVDFDDAGHANPAQRLDATDLAVLAGLAPRPWKPQSIRRCPTQGTTDSSRRRTSGKRRQSSTASSGCWKRGGTSVACSSSARVPRRRAS